MAYYVFLKITYRKVIKSVVSSEPLLNVNVY